MNFVSRQNELLFYKADIKAVIDAQSKKAMGEIQGIDPDRLLNTPVDDLVAYTADKYRIEVPALHRDGALLDEPVETFIEVNDYGRRIRVPATLVTLTVSFDGDKDMFYVRPSTFDSAPPAGCDWRSNGYPSTYGPGFGTEPRQGHARSRAR
jgi:hypothetical protein